jgi:ABC-type transport system involved in multi-copper enzyme maturation permease subunit
MNWRSIRAIAMKDFKEVRQNKAAWIPALVLPLVFAVGMPLLFIGLPQLIPVKDVASEMGDIQDLIVRMPANVQQVFASTSLEQAFVIYGIGFMLAPMFLIMPLMFSSIIGADSFVGERERKTMEALLYTPTSDGTLFMGKIIASVVPAILLSWLSYVIYIVVVNATSWPLFGHIWFPLPAWWPLMLWLTPAISLLGMSATVLISSRVKTFMEAYQLTGSLVVLVLALMVGQISGVLYLGVFSTFAIGTLVWIVDAVLIYISVGTFNRTSLIAKI